MAERTLEDIIVEQIKRLIIAQINKNTEEKADDYYSRQGRAYYSLSGFHQAIVERFKQFLSITRGASDRESEAIAYHYLADRESEAIAYHYLASAYNSLSEFQRAIECFKKCLSIAQEIGNRKQEGCAYGNLGCVYRSLSKFQQAKKCHKQHLSIAQEVGNKTCEGIAYGNLGVAYESLSEFKRAIEYQTKSLSIAKEIGDREGEECAYANLGVVYRSLSESHRAIEYHEQALSIAQEIGSRKGEGRAYCNLGCAYQSLSEFQQAIEYYKKSLSIDQEIGNREGEGGAYNNLGNAYQSLSEFQQAIEYYKKSLSIDQEIGNREGEGGAYNNLGNAYQSLSEFQQAIEYYKKSLSIDQEIGNREGEGGAYNNLGNAYQSLSEFQQAIEYYKKSLSIAQEIGNRKGEGGAYCNLGNAYESLRDFPQAMEYHKKHLTIVNKVGDREGEGVAYSSLGHIHSSLGDHQRAIECYKQHLSTAKICGNKEGEGVAYCNLGSAYYRLKDFKEALEYFKEHLIIAEEIGDRKGEGCAHKCLGLSLLPLGFLNKALHHFRCSVKVFDTIRASFISEDVLKISFRTSQQSAYTHLWQVLLSLNRSDEALYAAERGRAQALLDALKETYGLTSLSPRSIESEEEVINISKKTTVSTVFFALEENLLSMWVLRKEGNPIFRGLKLPAIGKEHEDSFSLLLDTVLKKIGAGVGIRCENRSMDKLSTTTSTTRDEHQASEASQETTDCLQLLYKVLIGPIENLLDGDELIVVPDGALCKAPWAALSETLRIRTVPSLTSLKVITDSPCEYHSKSGALLVGDPCLKKITDKRGNPIYDPLKYARMEVEMIGKILESQPLTGEDATKEAVLQRIGSVALIHIAAHGRKETGEIVLAPDPRWESDTPKEEDCIMKMSDIQAVKLRARLVVLSCCHSGQGEVSSEGVVGMARAFLFAGARSVLATLWAIDDEATMMFMKSFYQQLGSGESASVALQRAMKCLRDSHDYSAPKYWAPFVLMGDDVKIELENESLSKS